jgi:hypothetical protein
MPPLSQAQLDQRRNAGRALKDKVDPSYYRFIGRLGGLKRWFNILKASIEYAREVDRKYQRTVLAIELPGRFNQFESADEHLERYRRETGTKIMLFIFEPGNAPGKLILLNGRRKGPRGKRPKRSATHD